MSERNKKQMSGNQREDECVIPTKEKKQENVNNVPFLFRKYPKELQEMKRKPAVPRNARVLTSHPVSPHNNEQRLQRQFPGEANEFSTIPFDRIVTVVSVRMCSCTCRTIR